MTAAIETAPRLPELAPRVGPLQGLRQTLTLARRVIIQVRHNPQELADQSFQPIIFTLLFTYVFGASIASDGDRQTYLQFMIPGMLAMNMLFNSLYVGQGLNTDLAMGVFDRMRTLPIARWAPLAGRILADQLMQLWGIVLVFAVGLLLGFRPGNGVQGMLAGTLLLLFFALAFSWVAVLVGVASKNAQQVQVFGMAVVLPINFVSGTFAPVETMPTALQKFAEYTPVGNLLEASRGLINGGPVATPLWWTVVWAVALVLIFAPLSIRSLNRKT
ncbi:ABC transporter permease [Actinomadura kijaniata]|uniref:Transport permease protein n=1 Tax=Actinomadura namibiensis TaxID=182080 RepID=A0A7W3QMZ0_ACTNM|nr:ABC transporter permease [Actinomadura namibiensis]MBA8953050.1 ABC transporter DrrB family efflux protein [Actinomadura namibiensis]